MRSDDASPLTKTPMELLYEEIDPPVHTQIAHQTLHCICTAFTLLSCFMCAGPSQKHPAEGSRGPQYTYAGDISDCVCSLYDIKTIDL
jgi:hypothetical protein